MVLVDFNQWLGTANALIVLITGLFTLIGTGVGTFFAIKNYLKALKEKKASEIWAMIMESADSGIKEAERLAAEGLLEKGKKKEYVIGIVKATLKAAGIDISAFLDQLSDYIDQCVKFVNDMNGRK